MNNRPDFKSAYIAATELLVASNQVQTLPIDVTAIIEEQSGIKLLTASKFEEYGLPIPLLGSESAVILKYGYNHIIVFNQNEIKQRISFSISHEYGHYELNHIIGNVPEELYGKYEVEANYFAAQLLMPEQIIHEFTKRGRTITKSFLADTFSVSFEAAEKRINTLNKLNYSYRSDEEKFLDECLIAKFSNIINQVCPIYNPRYFDDEEEYLQKQRDQWYY